MFKKLLTAILLFVTTSSLTNVAAAESNLAQQMSAEEFPRVAGNFNKGRSRYRATLPRLICMSRSGIKPQDCCLWLTPVGQSTTRPWV